MRSHRHALVGATFVAVALAACAASPETGGDDDVPLPPLGAGVATLSGGPKAGYVDGPRGDARFDNPVNVAVGDDGMVYVADFNNDKLRRLTPAGTVDTLVDDPRFQRPFGMVLDADGVTLYAQTDRASTGKDTGALWSVDVQSGALALIADDVGRPRGLAQLPDGRLVAARYMQHDLRVIDPTTGDSSPLAGMAGESGMLDERGTAARFHMPYDVVVLPGEVIVVSDQMNGRLRRVHMDGSTETYATGFSRPQGLALDAAGAVYVSDVGAGKIFAVVDGQPAAVAGDGGLGYADAEDPFAAQFFAMEGIDVTRDGAFLYVADGDGGDDLPYHRVRRLAF